MAFRRTVGVREHPKEAVVDLDAGEWKVVPDRELENPRGKSDRP